MRTAKIFLLLISITTVYTTSFAQTDSLGWSYFPFKTGDMWEYLVYDGIRVDTAQNFNTKDSVSVDGKIHLTQQFRFIKPVTVGSFSEYTLDTLTAEVIGPSGELGCVSVYRFNAQPGDQWVMKAYKSGGYEMARVKEIYEGVLFGANTTFMQIRYYLAQDSSDTIGLSRYGDILAKGFGLVQRFATEGGFLYSLKGAVVNGVLYGDTTYLVTSVDGNYERSIPRGFELHQNYPNPFNPSTQIKYALPSRSKVVLKIFDVLGREIRTLVEDVQEAGSYTVSFDARGLASGVCFYRLQATGGGQQFVGIKKLLLLR
ncbi:MAG: T9SS type A sorting domain-containing protein [Bacteroidota bacterium]